MQRSLVSSVPPAGLKCWILKSASYLQCRINAGLLIPRLNSMQILYIYLRGIWAGRLAAFKIGPAIRAFTEALFLAILLKVVHGGKIKTFILSETSERLGIVARWGNLSLGVVLRPEESLKSEMLSLALTYSKHLDITNVRIKPRQTREGQLRMRRISYCSDCWFLFCVEVLRPSQPNGVMSSAVSLPNYTFTGQAYSVVIDPELLLIDLIVLMQKWTVISMYIHFNIHRANE